MAIASPLPDLTALVHTRCTLLLRIKEIGMLTTVEGIYKDGRVELSEPPKGVEGRRVLVTFLPEPPAAASASEANRRMLGLLKAWKAEPLTPAEESVLDDFDAFQAQHPLRLTRIPGESRGSCSTRTSSTTF
jgi:hypothetical protein